MENKKISIALLVLVLCSLLLFSSNINVAYAVVFYNITLLNGAEDALAYNPSINAYVTIGNNGTINRVSSTLFTVNSATLSGFIGGTWNDGIACSITSDICVAGFDRATTDRLMTFNSLGATLSTLTISTRLLQGEDLFVNSNSLYVPVVCSGADTDRIVQVYSISGAITLTGELGDCAGTNWGANNFNQLKVYDSELSTAVQGASNQWQLWNVGGGRICTATVAVDTFDYSSTNENYYLSTGSGTVQIYDNCTDVGDITSAQHLQTGSIRNIAVNDARNELYIVGTVTVSVMNLTNTSQLLQLIPIGGDSGASNRYKFAVGSNVEQIANIVSSTLNIRELDPTATEDAEGGNQIDGRCGNGTALECIGDRGTLNAITGAPALTTVVTDLGNGLGIFNSTNTDPETNGSGLFLMLATGVFFFAISVSTVGIANAKFNANISYSDSAMHPYYLLFLVAGVISLSWYLNWVPDIVFYGMVVGIAGLFAFGVYRNIGRG